MATERRDEGREQHPTADDREHGQGRPRPPAEPHGARPDPLDREAQERRQGGVVEPLMVVHDLQDEPRFVREQQAGGEQQATVDGPYENIAELLEIPAFEQFEIDPNDNVGDAAMHADIEERDWLLSLVANKFTVRSDVFTAYILVRIGTDGPQRRMIAIFDRSEVYGPNAKPKIIAIHKVPDPR